MQRGSSKELYYDCLHTSNAMPACFTTLLIMSPFPSRKCHKTTTGCFGTRRSSISKNGSILRKLSIISMLWVDPPVDPVQCAWPDVSCSTFLSLCSDVSCVPSSEFDYNLSCWGHKIVVVTPDTSNAMPAFDIEAEYQNMSTSWALSIVRDADLEECLFFGHIVKALWGRTIRFVPHVCFTLFFF